MLDERYSLLRQVKGVGDGPKVYLGHEMLCRFCGSRDPTQFRKIAHTIPEALGNKWIFSKDECDNCNAEFSVYDDALANSISPFLTLGGTKGKANKVRQTGRSSGSFVRHQSADQGKHLFIHLRDAEPHSLIKLVSGSLSFNIPIAAVPFRPRHAYKALTKIGFALLPDDELRQFDKLRHWLLSIDDSEEFPCLDVAISFGAIGNAPPMVAASLLRRTDPQDMVPYMLLILCAGSLCFQIDLMSDQLDDHIRLIAMGSLNILQSLVIDPKDGRDPLRIDYDTPVHQNWSTNSLLSQPIESMILDFDLATSAGCFTPVLRKPASER